MMKIIFITEFDNLRRISKNLDIVFLKYHCGLIYAKRISILGMKLLYSLDLTKTKIVIFTPHAEIVEQIRLKPRDNLYVVLMHHSIQFDNCNFFTNDNIKYLNKILLPNFINIGIGWSKMPKTAINEELRLVNQDTAFIDILITKDFGLPRCDCVWGIRIVYIPYGYGICYDTDSNLLISNILGSESYAERET